jgi:hypothetical protein
MFEEQQERTTSALAWTFSVMLLVGAGVGGWLLVNNLRQCEAQLTQANGELAAGRRRVEIEHTAAERCTQQLTACKTDFGTCNTSLATAQARVNELESAKPAEKPLR